MMKVQSKMKLFIAILCYLIPIASYSEGHGHEAEAHVHGVASMNWVLERTELSIVLQSPMMNLLGFEYRPKNKDEKLLFAAMTDKLKNPTKVIELIGGECRLMSANISNPFREEIDHEEEGATLSHEPSHSGITAKYDFLCQQPSQFEAMNVELFNTFSDFKMINAQWIVNGKQGAAELNQHQHLIKVR